VAYILHVFKRKRGSSKSDQVTFPTGVMNGEKHGKNNFCFWTVAQCEIGRDTYRPGCACVQVLTSTLHTK
jgi:hypothetical protein